PRPAPPRCPPPSLRARARRGRISRPWLPFGYPFLLFVTPAQAGVSERNVATCRPEIPAFAGMTVRSADDPQDVAFLHDDEVLTVDLHLGARPFAEQDAVAGLDVQRRDLAFVRARARADRDHFAFLRLFLGRIGNDD